jgi:nitrogen fixation/metabolism regulation signal transduction histidine kinase
VDGPNGSFDYLANVGPSLLYLLGQLRTDLPDLPFRSICTRQACDMLRRGQLACRAHDENIFRQRSEASINLSKNLGHDLTNIIATAKLDLMAVRQGLKMQPASGEDNRQELLRQSIEGLLENTKFLQEIVNIYRSFSYVKRPQYERHDLNHLLESFLRAYQPSVSARVEMRRELSDDIPTMIVEPRLLKLALFNLLTNAMDAFKRENREDEYVPTITIRTNYDGENDRCRMEVQDNGPGIRDEKGRLMGPGETNVIFHHGYSTKGEESEGLGLNWVRTIMEDFHNGSVHAENVPEGGAVFILMFKSMEAAEARIKA